MLDCNTLPQISVVYKIVNLQHPNRVYIGSAKNFRSRMQMHLCQLKNNKHHNYLLQRAVNKHGIDNFNVHIIDFCNETNLRQKEQFWLDTLEPFYNICKTVDQVETTPERELERKQKISTAQRGVSRKKNPSTNIPNVFYQSRDKMYSVQVAVNRKNYNLGWYKTIEEATTIADKYRHASVKELELFLVYKNSNKAAKRSNYNYVSYKLYKTRKCWYSYYAVNRKERIFFGYFDTELEAVRAYNNYITMNNINRPILIIKDN